MTDVYRCLDCSPLVALEQSLCVEVAMHDVLSVLLLELL